MKLSITKSYDIDFSAFTPEMAESYKMKRLMLVLKKRQFINSTSKVQVKNGTFRLTDTLEDVDYVFRVGTARRRRPSGYGTILVDTHNENTSVSDLIKLALSDMLFYRERDMIRDEITENGDFFTEFFTEQNVDFNDYTIERKW